MKIAYIFYSHHEYSDVWNMMKKQTDKFLPNEKKYLFTNEVGEFNFDDWEVVTYDDSLPYNLRVAECLNSVEEDVVIFHHEDMFLLSKPKKDVINDLAEMIVKKEAHLIKLIKAQYKPEQDRSIRNNIHVCPKNLYFAIQPTIVSKKILQNIYRNVEAPNIWKFEEDAGVYVASRNLKSYYYHTGEELKRGMFHWDSIVYPYIATAIVKGKWDYEHYKNELTSLLQKYNIDPSIRGTNA